MSGPLTFEVIFPFGIYLGIILNGKLNKNLHALVLSFAAVGVGGAGKVTLHKSESACGFSRRLGESLNLVRSTPHDDHSCSSLFLDTIIDLAVSKENRRDVADNDHEILLRGICDCPCNDFLLSTDHDDRVANIYGFDLYYNKTELSPGQRLVLNNMFPIYRT